MRCGIVRASGATELVRAILGVPLDGETDAQDARSGREGRDGGQVSPGDSSILLSDS
jgi:hypothetical protein